MMYKIGSIWPVKEVLPLTYSRTLLLTRDLMTPISCTARDWGMLACWIPSHQTTFGLDTSIPRKQERTTAGLSGQGQQVVRWTGARWLQALLPWSQKWHSKNLGTRKLRRCFL